MEKVWRKEGLCFFNILGLAGRAHRMFPDSLEPLTAFFAPVILPLYPVGRGFEIDGSTNSAHSSITSIGCIGHLPY